MAYIPDDLPEDMEPGLEDTAFYDPSNFVFPFGAHAAIVDVDVETGKVEVVRYVAVDDCGPAINPMLIDGQIHGGIAHAIGQALYEQVVYDEDGQLVTGTFVDYALPTAAELPSFETDRTETPTPTNSLGVKGIGEAGTIAASAAVDERGHRRAAPAGHHAPRHAADADAGVRPRSRRPGDDPRRVRLRRPRLPRRRARGAGRGRGGRQAPGRRPLARAAHEAAAGGALAARRPAARPGPARRRAPERRLAHRRADPARRPAGPGRARDRVRRRVGHRRPAGPQPRHDRRLARARRPGVGPADGARGDRGPR